LPARCLRLLQERGYHWRRLAGPASLNPGAEQVEDEAQAQQLQAMLGDVPGGAEVAAAAAEVTRHIPHLMAGLEFSGLEE
jgi:hypothetical protein